MHAREIYLAMGILVSSAALLWGNGALAQPAAYDSGTRYLTLPNVTVGPATYTDVVIRLDTFAVISVGGSAGTGVACIPGTLTASKFNAISVGMTLTQVNQLLGCQYTASGMGGTTFYTRYIWMSADGAVVFTVIFDATGSFIPDMAVFKTASGL